MLTVATHLGERRYTGTELPRIWKLATVPATFAAAAGAQTVATPNAGQFQGTLLSVESNRVELRDGEVPILQIASSKIVDVPVIETMRHCGVA